LEFAANGGAAADDISTFGPINRPLPAPLPYVVQNVAC
jgi:hypothetical protein